MTDIDLRPRRYRWLAPILRVVVIIIVIVLAVAGAVALIHISRAGHRAFYGEHA